jgi:hypothetical protein
VPEDTPSKLRHTRAANVDDDAEIEGITSSQKDNDVTFANIEVSKDVDGNYNDR